MINDPETIARNAPAFYSYPEYLTPDQWGLNGRWIIYADKIVSAGANAQIKLHFTAGKVFAVMGATKKPTLIKVELNGQKVVDAKGSDVTNSQITVTNNRLYSIIAYDHPNDGILELTATEPGLEIYTFTFGN